MDRKWLLGIGAGLIATATLITVGVAAYNAGENDSDRVIVAESELAEGGRYIVDYDRWDHHYGPGRLIFPLLIIGVILLVISRRRGAWHHQGWHGGPGSSYWHEWHRREHGLDAVPTTTPRPADVPPADAPSSSEPKAPPAPPQDAASGTPPDDRGPDAPPAP